MAHPCTAQQSTATFLVGQTRRARGIIQFDFLLTVSRKKCLSLTHTRKLFLSCFKGVRVKGVEKEGATKTTREGGGRDRE